MFVNRILINFDVMRLFRWWIAWIFLLLLFFLYSSVRIQWLSVCMIEWNMCHEWIFFLRCLTVDKQFSRKRQQEIRGNRHDCPYGGCDFWFTRKFMKIYKKLPFSCRIKTRRRRRHLKTSEICHSIEYSLKYCD